MQFVPIEIDDYVDLHMESNPDEDRAAFESRLREALAARLDGKKCDCGNPIWVIGSAVVGHACFTCITLESTPDGDYEIAEACAAQEP